MLDPSEETAELSDALEPGETGAGVISPATRELGTVTDEGGERMGDEHEERSGFAPVIFTAGIMILVGTN